MLRLNRVLNVAVAAVVVLALSGEAFAQYGGSTGGSRTGGSTGSRTSGGSGSSRNTGSSASQMGNGTSSGANGGVQLNAGDGSLATQVGTGFIGAGQVNANGTPAFVGSAQSSAQNQSRAAMQQFQAFNQGNNRRQQQFMNTPRQLPRPQLTIGFDFPPPTPSAMSSGLSTSLASVQALPLGEGRFAGVTFDVGTDGIVTLGGTVPDARSKQLAEMLVRVEPGVRGVTNNLTVATTAP